MEKMVALLLANRFKDIDWDYNRLTFEEKCIIKSENNFIQLKTLVEATINKHFNPDSPFFKYEAYDDLIDCMVDEIISK